MHSHNTHKKTQVIDKHLSLKESLCNQLLGKDVPPNNRFFSQISKEIHPQARDMNTKEKSAPQSLLTTEYSTTH
jgi:hypothetical protein